MRNPDFTTIVCISGEQVAKKKNLTAEAKYYFRVKPVAFEADADAAAVEVSQTWTVVVKKMRLV